MDRRMNPAAAASSSPLGEYTRVLTADVVKTSPAAKNPTIYCPLVSLNPRELISIQRLGRYPEKPKLPLL
jgi:hypothetical protein